MGRMLGPRLSNKRVIYGEEVFYLPPSAFFRRSPAFDARHSLNRFPLASSVTQQEIINFRIIPRKLSPSSTSSTFFNLLQPSIQVVEAADSGHRQFASDRSQNPNPERRSRSANYLRVSDRTRLQKLFISVNTPFTRGFWVKIPVYESYAAGAILGDFGHFRAIWASRGGFRINTPFTRFFLPAPFNILLQSLRVFPVNGFFRYSYGEKHGVRSGMGGMEK